MDNKQGKSPMDETCKAMLRTVNGAREAGLMSANLAAYLEVLALGSRPCPMSGGRVNGFSVEHFCDKVHRERSTVNRMTRKLEREGWIVVNTPSNGLRGRGHSGRIYGIDLRPLIAREAEVREAVETCRAASREGRELRETLRAEKGRVARFIAAAKESGAEADADRAVELLETIPRRFGSLPSDVLREMVEAVETFFERLEQANAEAAEASGRSKMQHHRVTDGRPHTHTKKRNLISNRSAEENDAARGSRKTHGSTFGDVKLSEILNALDPNEMEELRNFASDGPQQLWQGLQFIAVTRWHQTGGDHATCKMLFTMLGEQQGTVLLLLITEQAQRGHVRDLSRYAAACAAKARNGQFMWGAGVRSAVLQCAARTAA